MYAFAVIFRSLRLENQRVKVIDLPRICKRAVVVHVALKVILTSNSIETVTSGMPKYENREEVE